MTGCRWCPPSPPRPPPGTTAAPSSPSTSPSWTGRSSWISIVGNNIYTIYTLSIHYLHTISTHYLHNLNSVRCVHPRQLPLGLPRSIPSLEYDPRPRDGGQEATGHPLPRLRRGRQPPLRVHSDPGRRRTGLLETRNTEPGARYLIQP